MVSSPDSEIALMRASGLVGKSRSHPVHAHYHGRSAPFGIRVANAITETLGSWTFLVIQTVAIGLWVVVNIAAAFHHFDPYPFIFLNLVFSLQSAYAGPLVLMAGNVAAAKDRELWESDYATNQEAFEKILALERQILELAAQNKRLVECMERIPGVSKG